MTREAKLVKNTMIIALGNITTKIISFFMLPLYTALLTTEEYGTVNLISVYVMLLTTILTLQLEQGVFRYLVEARNDIEEQKRYIATTVLLVVFINLGFLSVAAPLLAIFHYKYTVLLLCNTFASVSSTVLLSISRGLGDNKTYAIGSCIAGSLNVLLNVVFIAVLHWNVMGMLLATIIAVITAAIFILLKLKLWSYISLRYFRKDKIAILTKYSLPLIPYTLCWWAINVSDRMIISYSMNTSYNGIYAIAYKFPSMFTMITNIFQTSWIESASENISEENRNHYYQSILRKIVRLYASANVLAIACLPFVFSIFINDSFSEAYYYIPILLMAAFFQSISALFGSIYFAFKETKRVSKTNVIATFLNVLINLALINRIGLYAAALSTLVAYLVVVLMRYADIKKMIGMKFDGRYIFLQVLSFSFVVFCYYSSNVILKIIALTFALALGYLQNRKTMYSIIKMAIDKLKRT